MAGVLDDYTEAHVHGVVRIDRDVEALVLDPGYRDTVIEEQAPLLGTPVEWHKGRTLSVADLIAHPHYRGQHIVDVGRRIAHNAALNAFVICQAVLGGHEDSPDLKKVWHHVARFGSPAATRPHQSVLHRPSSGAPASDHGTSRSRPCPRAGP